MTQYDRVYTVGCFDWFHKGHDTLLKNLRSYGKTVIVGIHDDDSIEKLKKLKPHEHQTIKERMANIKEFADIVYVIPDKDPTFFLKCVVNDDDTKDNACFIRGDDMPNFPGREFIENKMSIKLLPYTQGVSSTEIRKNIKI
jgi:cytidyltransferase-like protein